MSGLSGCCSLYRECSDNRACVNTEDPDANRCYYRKNLEAGKIFYGKNANFGFGFEQRENQLLAECKEIYIACFRQLYTITKRSSKMFYSYSLDKETVKELRELFNKCKIPYRTEKDFEDIPGFEFDDGENIFNSRVILEYDESEFIIYTCDINYGIRLIKPYYSDRIAKAFSKNGISSRVEVLGKAAMESNPHSYTVKEKEVVQVKVSEDRKVDIKLKGIQIIKEFKQQSLFDIYSIQTLCPICNV
jgi:hypothetical protein